MVPVLAAVLAVAAAIGWQRRRTARTPRPDERRDGAAAGLPEPGGGGRRGLRRREDRARPLGRARPGADRVFARTRSAGPDDLDRYRQAAAGSEDTDGSCAAAAGAAAPAMADGKSHLAAMERSRTHHVDDAKQVWIAAWRSAPTQIEAYDQPADTSRRRTGLLTRTTGPAGTVSRSP